MIKRISVIVMALMLTLAPMAWATASVLQPTDDFYVNDAAGVLTGETIGHIVLNNDALYDACGAQIVIVTVNSVGGATMEDYADTLFDEWGIGSAEKNNGLLLVMAIGDDDYWMTEGTGLRRAITAGDLNELMDTYLEPYFAEKDYDAGAKALFDAAFEAVCAAEGLNLKVDQNAYANYIAENGTGETEEEPETITTTQNNTVTRTATQAPARQEGGSAVGGFVVLVIVAIIVVLIIRAARRPRTTTYTNTTTYVDNSASSYRRGFFMGNLLGRASRRTPPPPPQYPVGNPPPSGRTNTATRPSAPSRPSSGGSIFGSGSSRPASTSKPSSGGSIFGSGSSRSTTSRPSSSGSIFGSGRSSSSSSRSSFGSGRSSSRSSFSSGRSSFGGGRSGGGGSARGGGAGRHR